tara:strand:+ start:115 stop:258 length:144 start_codon:yes stop_codon:yes gene_type:complete
MTSEREERIIERIGELATLLGGTMKKSRRNYRGRLSKFVEIEYDITN